MSRICSPMSSGTPAGESLRSPAGSRPRLGLTDPLLHFTDGRQVFIDLAAIIDAQPVTKLLGVVQHEIEDALSIECPVAPGRLANSPGRPGGKSRSKTSLGIDFLGHRHVGRPPGDVRRIRTAIARVAIPRSGAPFDPQFERGEPRLSADLLGGHLVDRDTHADAGPIGLEGWTPVKKLASERAWSPGPSPSASALCWASPVKTSNHPGVARAARALTGARISTPSLRVSSRADARRWARRKRPCAGVRARPRRQWPPAVPSPRATGRAIAVPSLAIRSASRSPCSRHWVSPFRGCAAVTRDRAVSGMGRS